MKLLNNKGFVFVETLIVTVFVVTIFMMVYQNIVPNIGEYEKMVSYDDIDSVYASNLMKQVVLRYTDLNYIDTELTTSTYVDISDCSNTLLYKDKDYCEKIKNNLKITNDDRVFITKYDISLFREEAMRNDYFDSGKLSNFRSYINKLSDVESFYTSVSEQNASGKYRLFMTRTVTNSDLSTSLKYVNIGIFLGNYTKYHVGDTITFNPGDGDKEFYVLKNSPSNDSTVTLILASNLTGTVPFNSSGVSAYPDTVISNLNSLTSNWTNVVALTDNDQYISSSNYVISYTGSHARLLNENDIYELLGCSNSKLCFDIGSSFAIELNNNTKFLASNLTNNNGYWLAATNTNNQLLAWSIKNNKIISSDISNITDIGIRPVIIVDKNKLSIGE